MLQVVSARRESRMMAAGVYGGVGQKGVGSSCDCGCI